jgi:hypothetical protein
MERRLPESAFSTNNLTEQTSQKHYSLLLIAILIVVAVAALPILTYPLGRDQGEFATIGRGLLQGRIPYVELWNPKPPAVFYVYAGAMALFGQSSAALRALDLIAVPIVAAALYFIGGRVANRRVGLWAALIFPVFYFTESFWTLTQNDGLALVPMALAMACTFRAAEGGRGAWRWAFTAGALCAWTLWFKYPFVLFVAVVMVGYGVLANARWRAIGGLSRPAESKDFKPTEGAVKIPSSTIFAFLSGGLLVGLGGMAYLAALGALDALVQSASVTSQYTALGFNAADFGAALQTYAGFRWAQWGLLFVLALAWPVLRVFRVGEQTVSGRAWGVVWLWLLAGLGMMLVQAKGYDYHWLPMLPPLALIGADVVEGVISLIVYRWQRWVEETPPQPLPVNREGLPESQYSLVTGSGEGAAMGFKPSPASMLLRGVIALGLVMVLVAGIWPKALPYLMGRESETEYARQFQAGEFVADESLEVAAFLRERVVRGDSLFIWGFRPEVYYLSGLNPATRFIFQFPLVGAWYPAAWKQEAVDVLWPAMPPYVLVLQVDYMPWVTGRHEDSNTLLQEYTELNNWLVFNYERETQIGNFFVWRRKS